MALPGNKDFNDYDNYVTDPNPTTSAQAQDYFRNQAELLKAVIDCDFWQPETVYQPGDVVKSDSMPNGTEAVMVATKASVTSNVEPQWGAVGGANISDGACFWKLRWQHWSKEVASVDDMKNGTSNDKLVTPKLARLGQTATNRLPNTVYSVGNVVYVDSNLSVALKCTTEGATSNTELDISNKAVGESVEDGTCVWKLVSRVSDGMPVGFKYFDWVKEIPVGALGALGALYNRELYADLWKSAQENKQVITEAEWQALAQANDGNVPWYSDGDGSTTFRVPALKCWFKGASGVEEVGNYLEAGLPATEASSQLKVRSIMISGEGGNPFYCPAYIGVGTLTSLPLTNTATIYGNSDTVQPPSLIGIWLIKAYGTVTNVGNADVADVMQAVEQVQTSVGTLEQGVGTLEQGVGTAVDYIVESYRNGTSWYEVYNSGKVRQGGEFVATSISETTIALLLPFADNNYFVSFQVGVNAFFNDYRATWGIFSAWNLTETHFTTFGHTTAGLQIKRWVAEGQGA